MRDSAAERPASRHHDAALHRPACAARRPHSGGDAAPVTEERIAAGVRQVGDQQAAGDRDRHAPPAEALPRATASAHRRATPGGNSSPRTSTGAPARSSPESPRSATNSSGSRRSLSISLDISRAVTAICRATVSISFALLGGALVRSGWFMAISAFVVADSWFNYVTTIGSVTEPVWLLNHGRFR